VANGQNLVKIHLHPAIAILAAVTATKTTKKWDICLCEKKIFLVNYKKKKKKKKKLSMHNMCTLTKHIRVGPNVWTPLQCVL